MAEALPGRFLGIADEAAGLRTVPGKHPVGLPGSVSSDTIAELFALARE